MNENLPTPPKSASLAAQPAPSPTRCPDCMRRVRKMSEKAWEWPGTVAMTTREGHCAPCKRARQTALIEADRLALAAAQEEALAEAEERDRVAAEADRKAEEAAAALARQKRPRCLEEECPEESLTSGRCSKHYRAFCRERQRVKDMPGLDGMTAAERRTKQSLEAYWADRRRRRVPPEGKHHGVAQAS